MSPPRRRSARLASATSGAVKGKASSSLENVMEGDQTPSRVRPRDAKADDPLLQESLTEPTTPASSSALKPSHSEMHPSRYRCSTGPPSSALRLGFSDIPNEGRTRGQDGTPSKVKGVPAFDFEFQIAHDPSHANMSNDAQRMMHEIRSQAAKIKPSLVAQREAERDASIADRPFAKPKGKVGRFSAAHMAEFKKMDSIEGHASAWRAQEGRFTPAQPLKRTSSKAELATTPTSQKKKNGAAKKARKTGCEETLNPQPKPSLKRKSSAANLDSEPNRQGISKRHHGNATSDEPLTAAKGLPASTTEKLKLRQTEDVASSGPTSVTTSPQKTSSVFSRLASPKRAPLVAQPAPTKAVPKPTVTLVHSPSRSGLNHSKSAAISSPSSTSRTADLTRRIISPRSFTKVKSILRGNSGSSSESKSAIPGPQNSQTPDAPRFNNEPTPAAFTTPRRKLTKRVTFTPDVVTAVNKQNSPSPQKSWNAKLRPALKAIGPQYPALDEVLAESDVSHSLYPDLSSLKHLLGCQSPRGVTASSSSKPGTFTFRSDHTIQFGDASSGFGASVGQSSVRQVEGPPASGKLPGSFPGAAWSSSHSDKENQAPSLSGTVHGMQNKKRHRASSEDDDFDSSRATKKRKNENVPEGQELLAPRLVKNDTPSTIKTNRRGQSANNTPNRRIFGLTPLKSPCSPSPRKTTKGISMSRLNMLARPKNRA